MLPLSLCPEPCVRTTFRLQSALFNSLSSFSSASVPSNRSLYFFYTDTSTAVSTEALILSPPGFVGAVGGSLGLFLGVSLLSVASAALDLVIPGRRSGVKVKATQTE